MVDFSNFRVIHKVIFLKPILWKILWRFEKYRQSGSQAPVQKKSSWGKIDWQHMVSDSCTMIILKLKIHGEGLRDSNVV